MARTDQIRVIAAQHLADRFPDRAIPRIYVAIEIDDAAEEVFRVTAHYQPADAPLPLDAVRAAAKDFGHALNRAGIGGFPILTLQPMAAVAVDTTPA